MQGRMKQHQLTAAEIEKLLAGEEVGRIATVNPDGSPYIVPVHFVYHDGKIYIHGLIKGQKISNINSNPAVCFEVDRMQGIIMSDEPCNVNTEYQSVVVLGSARLVQDERGKEDILRRIVGKYAPSLSDREMPVQMLKATSVIEIEIKECTGKYYK